MIRTALILIVTASLVGCSRSPVLPTGISVQVAPSKDVVITLSEGTAVQIRQNKNDPRIALVSYQNGGLHIVQLEQNGETPREMNLISREKAEISVVSSAQKTLLLDEDGDGIPDIKIDGKKKFKRANIEWTEISK